MTETPAKRTRPLLIAILAAVGIATLTFNHYWVARPVGSGPAGPAVPRAAFE